ncbi:hypothetical protein BST81_22230 [Leptolyngbya sp. 'hensonii']|uniref:PEP-CTERM sorting domain-containing protein n=1 Tax=Leptolyngbya sp. 'hensonii' TaxID=1922337 RepID=UPI00094F59D6|nr:PEP-CTERM sorting domain-containing protein [Leptolyngbya sp. 'hensonii']OLP16315.1 hypothetical protein BST81_22230 [Leptolyngbya sp. 'hensonii']
MWKPTIPHLIFIFHEKYAWSSAIATIGALVSALAFTTHSGQAATLSLDFNSLPSQQGWTYGTSLGFAEQQIFSVTGTSLIQNSLITGFQSSGGMSYYIDNQIDPSLPFTFEIRTRILSSPTAGWSVNYYGFFFGISIGSKYVSIALDERGIQSDFTVLSPLIPINTKDFHTYRVEGTPEKDFSLFVDGTLIFQSPLIERGDGSNYNRILFGDGTGGTNANAEITYLSFRQGNQDAQSVPEPLGLLGISTVAGLGLRLRRKSQSKTSAGVSC